MLVWIGHKSAGDSESDPSPYSPAAVVLQTWAGE